MKKTKKQILGLAGLAAVGIMTAIAVGIQGNDASAYQWDTTVEVMVAETNLNNTFVSPLDRSETTSNIVNVVTNYSQAKKIDYRLTYTGSDGIEKTADLEPYYPIAGVGTHSFDLDLTPYGYGAFSLSTFVTGLDGIARETDTVSFTYRAISIEPNAPVNDKNEPTITIEVSDETARIEFVLFDEKGEIARDKNGNMIKAELTRADIDPATGKLSFTLPLEEYGLPSGKYTVVITAYDQDNKILSMLTYDFTYESLAPETPNTGSLSLGDLNISRMDYILTGMIAFAVAAAFALTLVFRKNRR